MPPRPFPGPFESSPPFGRLDLLFLLYLGQAALESLPELLLLPPNITWLNVVEDRDHHVSVMSVRLCTLHYLDELIEAPAGVGVVGGEEDEGNPRAPDRIQEHGPNGQAPLAPVVVAVAGNAGHIKGAEQVGQEAPPGVLAPEANKNIILPVWSG